MAKNTSSSAFRKIDVDEYNEDNYKDEDANQNSSIAAAAGGFNEGEINGMVAGGRVGEALLYCLKNAPVGSKSQEVKDSSTHIILRLLTSIKQSNIEEVVSQLDQDSIDVLMKYIYRGFETPSDGSSAHLLSWHEKVYAVGGIGSITRVLTDKRRV